MALITCNINRDGNGITKITYTVQRLDQNDELILVSNTTNAALNWTGASPFAPAAATKPLLVPQASAAPAPLKITASTQQNAICGEVDNGVFFPWQGAGFPIPGTQTKDGQ